MILLLYISLLSGFLQPTADSLENKIEFREMVSNLSRVTDMYATPSGHLYVLETGKNRLIKYDTAGKRIEVLGSRGIGDYGFNRPGSVDATNGMRIYVADTNNNRVQLFDRRHQYIGTIRAPERQGFSSVHFAPAKVTVNKFGETFVYDNDSENILRFNEQGRFVQSVDLKLFDIDTPLSSLTNFEDTLFLAERQRNAIHMISSGGGYLGFIPTSAAVRALFRSERHIWAVSSTHIYRLDFRGRIVEKNGHTIRGNITAITAHDRRLFIATESAIFTAAKP
jgi:hypothetical protein